MKWLIAALVVVALGLALYFMSCNGRGGVGLSTSASSGSGDAPKRCDVRVAAAGITVDGKPATRDEAVKTCKGRPGADVVVTGDARQGDWDALRSAFDASGIAVYLRR